MENRPSYPVGAVDNALRTLKLLRERGELRVSDVADHLGVARSTAHRLLAMLRYHGFAEQDRQRLYRPGPALLPAAHWSGAIPGLLTAAHPRMRELSAAVGETTHLMVLQGNGTQFIDGVEGTGSLRVATRTGMLLPAHTTSGGKALLAELPDDDLRALFPRGLPMSQEELATIRKRGYALNLEESERGIRAIGTCVRNGGGRAIGGRAVAGLAISVPASRHTRRSLVGLCTDLTTAAGAIGNAL